LAKVREHLIDNGRHADFRIWRGPGDRDSSDEEWEEQFWRPTIEHDRVNVDEQVETRRMVDNTFQQDCGHLDLEERVWDVAVEAFAMADAVHEQCFQDGDEERGEDMHDDGLDEAVGESDADVNDTNAGIDPRMLEEAIKPLYRGARCTELAATILLMNLCTVHGVSNSFVEELFSLMHSHLLPEENSLPKNYYAAKSLTGRLGLSYRTIHACRKGCIPW
jgi:hypothetical protein